jgi:hypothetical protein
MTVTTSPWQSAQVRPPDLEGLIEEARRRAQRRRARYAGVALAGVALALGAFFLLARGGGGPPGAGNPSANGPSGPPAGAHSAGTQDRFVRFAELPHGWVEGIPRDVRAASRIVGQLDGHKIAAAPTRNGNFCEAFSARGGGWGGCRVRVSPAPWQDGRGELRSYLIGAGGLIGHAGHAVVSGTTLVSPGPKLYLLYADGSSERLRIVWVSKPIAAGFFYRVIPSAHRVRSRRATALEMWRGSHLVARQVLLPAPPFP